MRRWLTSFWNTWREPRPKARQESAPDVEGRHHICPGALDKAFLRSGWTVLTRAEEKNQLEYTQTGEIVVRILAGWFTIGWFSGFTWLSFRPPDGQNPDIGHRPQLKSYLYEKTSSPKIHLPKSENFRFTAKLPKHCTLNFILHRMSPQVRTSKYLVAGLGPWCLVSADT